MTTTSDLAGLVRTAKNHYSRLGIKPSVDSLDIRRAYHQRAKLLHPDKNRSPDATSVFQRLQEAFAVLNDPAKRASYDAAFAAKRPCATAAHAWVHPLSCDQLAAELRSRGLNPAHGTPIDLLRRQLLGLLSEPGAVVCNKCSHQFKVILTGSAVVELPCPKCRSIISIAGSTRAAAQAAAQAAAASSMVKAQHEANKAAWAKTVARNKLRAEQQRKAAEHAVQQQEHAATLAAEQRRQQAAKLVAEQQRQQAAKLVVEQRRQQAAKLVAEQRRQQAEKSVAEQQRQQAAKLAAEQRRQQEDYRLRKESKAREVAAAALEAKQQAESLRKRICRDTDRSSQLWARLQQRLVHKTSTVKAASAVTTPAIAPPASAMPIPQTNRKLYLQPEDGPSIPLFEKSAGSTFIGRTNQKHIANPCFSRYHLELKRSVDGIELTVVGLNPVKLWSPSGSAVTIQTGGKREVSPGDHIDIVKDDPQLRFVLTEGAIAETLTATEAAAGRNPLEEHAEQNAKKRPREPTPHEAVGDKAMHSWLGMPQKSRVDFSGGEHVKRRKYKRAKPSSDDDKQARIDAIFPVW